MSVILTILSFIAGAFIGLASLEFISKKLKSSKLAPPLKCTACQVDFQKHDKLPIYRFISTKFRCRHCSSWLNWQYFAVELLSGIALASVVLSLWGSEIGVIQAIATFLALMLLIKLFLLKRVGLLKEKFLYSALLALFVFSILITGSFYLPVVGGLVIGAFFAFQHLISSDWISYEEVLIGLLSGVILGIVPGFIALIMAIVFTSAIAVTFALIQRHKLHDEALFAEVLLLATFITLAFKDSIINWYFSII